MKATENQVEFLDGEIALIVKAETFFPIAVALVGMSFTHALDTELVKTGVSMVNISRLLTCAESDALKTREQKQIDSRLGELIF